MLLKNISFMAVSTGLRLVTGVLIFAALARLFGPASYGQLMLWLSIATLLSLVNNFGFGSYVIREMSVEPDNTGEIVSETFTAKLLLTAPLLLGSIIIGWFFYSESIWLLIGFLLATSADGFSDFFSGAIRAKGRFDLESRIVTSGSVLHAIVVVGAALIWTSVESVALGYAASRMLILGITTIASVRIVGAISVSSLDSALARINTASSYAVDFFLQSLVGQIDSVVLNSYLGSIAVGLYQAGARIFQAALFAPQILANVFLPRLAAGFINKDIFEKEARRAKSFFWVAGVVVGSLLAFFSGPIVRLLYGEAYSSLNDILYFFGALFYFRVNASAWGVLLTASGRQRARVIGGFSHWFVIFFTFCALPESMKIERWLFSLCIGNLFLGIFYARTITANLYRSLSENGFAILLVMIVSFYTVLK